VSVEIINFTGFLSLFFSAVLIGCITGFTRPSFCLLSIHLSVCVSHTPPSWKR